MFEFYMHIYLKIFLSGEIVFTVFRIIFIIKIITISILTNVYYYLGKIFRESKI